MTWTSTPPTTPGFYAWRATDDDDYVELCDVLVGRTGELIAIFAGSETGWTVRLAGGQWCKLVPADEIEKAWDEARETKSEETTSIGDDTQSWAVLYRVVWEESRAKRVMEGLE